MYHEASISAFWPDVNQEDFSPNQAELPESKNMEVKEVMLKTHNL